VVLQTASKLGTKQQMYWKREKQSLKRFVYTRQGKQKIISNQMGRTYDTPKKFSSPYEKSIAWLQRYTNELLSLRLMQGTTSCNANISCSNFIANTWWVKIYQSFVRCFFSTALKRSERLLLACWYVESLIKIVSWKMMKQQPNLF